MKNYLLLSLFIVCGLLLNAQITVSPNSGCAGSTFTVTISGLPSNVSSPCGTSSTAGLTPAGGGSVILAGTSVTNNTASLTIPSNFTPGTYGFSYTSYKTTANCQATTYTCTSCFTVVGFPSQPGTIAGNATPCSNSQQTYSVGSVSGATSYTWTLPSGWTGTSTTNSITVTTTSTSGTISVTANNNCGPSTARTLSVTPVSAPAQPGTMSGSTTPCSNSQQTYSVASVSGATSYTWSLPGGWTGTSTTNSITATVGNAGGTVSVIANNTCGSSNARTITATIATVPSQPASIAGTAAVCAGTSQTYSVTPVNGATSYTWSLPNGWTGTSTSASITTTVGNAGGTISVTANNTCGSSTARTLVATVTSAPAAPGLISGTTTPCANSQQTYSVATVSGATSYTWTLPGGWSGSSTTNSINATVGTSGSSVGVTANNSCGSSNAAVTPISVVLVPAQPGAISGTAAVCAGSSQTYSISPVNGANSYTWSLPNGWTGSSTSTSITTTVDNTGGTISVTADNGCGASTARTLTATVATTPNQPGTISGNVNACGGNSETYSVAAVNGATFYTWTLPNGWSGTSATNSITTTLGFAGGSLSVTAGNSCGSSAASSLSITVNNVPAQPGNISGSNNVCSGTSQTYSISPVSGASSYTWTLPADWTGTSSTNSITTTTGVTPGNVSVTANNGCGASPVQTLAVTFGNSPAQPGAISGNISLCAGNTQTYTISPVSGATSYLWTIQNSWSGSSTTTSITVTVDNNSGQLSVSAVNSCGASIPRDITLQVDSAPADIEITPAGTQDICTGTDITLNCIGSNIADYQWQFNGNDINGETNSSYLATAAGTYTCVASNRCGNSPSGNSAVISVVGAPTNATVSPAGVTGICTGTSQTLTCTATGATSYQWMVDGNDINGEVNSTYVANAAGVYTCKAINNCGTISSADTAVIAITTTPTAPTLSSSLGDSLCLGDSTVIAAAVGYSSYLWSTGETTNSIKVGATGSYIVTVTSTCGSVASNPYQVTVNTPVEPVITANGNVLECSVAGVSYVWFNNAITINGANAQTYTATQSGPYNVQVTNEFGCRATSQVFNFTFTGISATGQLNGLQLYPNPATGFVTIKFDGLQTLQLTMVTAGGQQVINMPNVASNTTLDLSKMARGVYFIKLSNGDSQVFKRLVIGE